MKRKSFCRTYFACAHMALAGGALKRSWPKRVRKMFCGATGQNCVNVASMELKKAETFETELKVQSSNCRATINGKFS